MASLEYVEKIKYLKPGASSFDKEGERISLTKGNNDKKAESYLLPLDGLWKLNGYDADVPGSVHTDLFNAGVIPDPYQLRNDDYAREMSFKEWDYTKEFEYTGSGNNVYLEFDGVCDRCDIYLNHVLLGSHQGMLAPFSFNVTDHIKKGPNTLHVHLYPAIDFNQTVVFNCSYGWHYARIWPLGIWRRVRLSDRPSAYFDHPFITTQSHTTGTMDLSVDICGSVKGVLYATVKPENFKGDTYTFKHHVNSVNTRLTFDIPDFKLWWPNGYGEQNLYRLDLAYCENDKVICNDSMTFGIRTLEMKPFPSGEKEDTYNRTCIINGRGVFMKGAGWCTIDALMRFDRKDYDKILSRAKQQGVNFLRAWGGGLVETDAFYDLCNEYGICVYQEWPCCWDSQKTQPLDLLIETVITQAKRIRNNPSLVLYGGGNEGYGAFEDEALNTIGALTHEYDGTRVFYRQDGGVSSKGMTHDHIHWGGEKPEHYITRYGNANEINLHEYGLDALMNEESILKFAAAGDFIAWPVDPKGVVAHHTATFNGEYGWSPTPHGFDMETFIHYSEMFLEPTDLKDVITGSQLAQAMAKYPALINSRIKWPYCTKAVYYKLNDVYPGASWSTVDWYGSPKMAHYLCQDAYMPLMACGFFDRYNTYDKENKDLTVPVYVLDDNNALSGREYNVTVKAYNSNLDCIKEEVYTGKGSSETNFIAGNFCLTGEEADTYPLIITFSLSAGRSLFRTYMYLNFDKEQNALFNLPETTLSWGKTGAHTDGILEPFCRFNEYGTEDTAFYVTNTGDKCAISVNAVVEDSDKTVLSDNFFFLEVGETKIIKISHPDKVKGFTCINEIKRTPGYADVSTGLKASVLGHDALKIEWDTVNGADGYAVFLNGKKAAVLQGEREYTVKGLNENTSYEVTSGIYYGLDLKMCGDKVTVKTEHDTTPPQVKNAFFDKPDSIIITFTKKISAEESSFAIGGFSIKQIKKEGGSVRLLLDKKVPEDKGLSVQIANIQDTSFSKNTLADTEIYVKPMLNKYNGYKYGEGTVFIRDTDYSIKNTAVIAMRIKPLILDGSYQVLFARAPKGGDAHFEFYLNPAGDLRMYSAKGDHYLGINLRDYEGIWCTFTVIVENADVKVYVNGKCTYHDKDRVSAEDGIFDIALGSLTDNSLVFKGELADVCLYTGLPAEIPGQTL